MDIIYIRTKRGLNMNKNNIDVYYCAIAGATSNAYRNRRLWVLTPEYYLYSPRSLEYDGSPLPPQINHQFGRLVKRLLVVVRNLRRISKSLQPVIGESFVET